MSDYNALQDQLNPHFLFNNLSILKSMIIYDQYSAVDFTQNFTDFYRYVLQSRGKTTVLLKDEIELLYSYIAIHKERLGENLQVKIDIGNDSIEKNIPPLSLQLLVENAIKHNIAGKENPLMIEVFTDTDSITVKNNLQPKESFYSTRNGLKNLVQRYKLIAEKEVEINQNEEFFTVKLPLL
jgi:LytS/YehU family sensor histidine kinase